MISARIVKHANLLISYSCFRLVKSYFDIIYIIKIISIIYFIHVFNILYNIFNTKKKIEMND